MKKNKKLTRTAQPRKPSIALTPFSKWHYAMPVVGILLIGFIYSETYKPKMENKWITGSQLVEKSRIEKDPQKKKEMIEKGGAILREQVRLHPYHAKVLHLFAFYFQESKNWDSIIFYERKALTFGTGGIINRVRSEGKNLYNAAVANKIDLSMGNPVKAMEIVNQSEIPGFDNPELERFRGIIHMNAGKIDSSIYSFRSYLKTNPKEFYTLMYMAKDYLNQSKLDSARKYAELAMKENKNDPQLQAILNQLNR